MADEIIKQEATAIAPVDDSPNARGTYMSMLDSSTSKATVYNALNDAQSLNESGVDEIKLVAIIIQPGIKAVSGEQCLNTTFLDENGNAYITQSNGIARAAQDLVSLYSGDVRGVTVKVCERAISGGRSVKYLRVVE